MLAGLNAQEAARQVSTCSDQVAQRTQAQLKDFTASVRSEYTLYTCFEISAQGTLLLDHALCLLLWESGGQGSGKSLCMCVV